MSNKRVKNEQWSIKELIDKINNKEISKPKYQRKKKWDITPKKDNTPNEKSYIEFLYRTHNSVHAITFGQDDNRGKQNIQNIDGNNRINAISHFIKTPFEVLEDHFKDLFKILDKINSVNVDEIKDIFKSMSYTDIIRMKRLSDYFESINKKELYHEIKDKLKDIENEIYYNIPKKLKIAGDYEFDSYVKINVNIFEGYDTDELCKTFEDINKFNSKLTEIELLASRLHNEIDFEIYDKSFEIELKNHILYYYTTKADDEVLPCYEYDIINDKINAHDFIVGFQNLCNQKYVFIEKTDVNGLSLFFKLYKIIYRSLNKSFSSKNVNEFIDNILYSCDILQAISKKIFTDTINDKLFNATCQKKIETLKKNNLVVIIGCIIGFKSKKAAKSHIETEITKCLLYHFMIDDIKEKVKRENYKKYDSITYRAGGGFIENTVSKILSNPEKINEYLPEEIFTDMIKDLIKENNNPDERYINNDTGSKKKDKRRKLKFYEKMLMFYYYKQELSVNMFQYKFSIEHICPNSSEWKGKLDKDRPGNLIPIIAEMNISRNNKHIKKYEKMDAKFGFLKFIKNIIPKYTDYDKIINHDNNKPSIINNKLYEIMCQKNEKIYTENFIKCLYNK